MKRKLIEYDVFTKITEDSLSRAEAELVKSEDVLARALDTGSLTLHCFGESDVTFETPEKTYIHANYQLDENALILDNIEELVIDDTSAENKSRELLTSMVDNLLDNNGAKASQAFEQFMALPTIRRRLMEGKEQLWLRDKSKPVKHRGKATAETIARQQFGKKISAISQSDEQKKRERKENKQFRKLGLEPHRRKGGAQLKKVKPGKIMEWGQLAENVAGYIDYQEFGPTMRQSDVRRDERGNVVAVRVPTSKLRTESKILNMTFKHMMDTEIKCLRAKVKTVHEDTAFCRAMADLRKCNALSDTVQLEDVLDAVVTRWPGLVYLTQAELASEIAQALESIGESNYDDQMCDFMAEGILRTATHAYSDRVNKVFSAAGLKAPKEGDVYEAYQNVATTLFSTMDETQKLEMQVFADLYGALVEVHRVATEEGNEALRAECNNYLRSLHSVLKQEEEPTLELAGEVAGFLSGLVETNLGDKHWDVSNTPHQTVTGDHPQMAKNAAKGYTPSSDFEPNWGGTAPVSDGKSYRNGLEDEMRNRSWGNIGGEDTWPSLRNPYVPKPFGEYKMKEKSAVDDGQDDWSRFQNKDTWPNLQNPYVPEKVLGRKAMTPQNYKMKEKDLIVDK